MSAIPNRLKSTDDLRVEIEAEIAWQKHVEGKSLTQSRRRVTLMRNEIERRSRLASIPRMGRP